MIGFYKSVNGIIMEIEAREHDCWVNMVNPTKDEIDEIANELSIDREMISAALDEEETSRIEAEDDNTLLIVDVPYAQKTNNLLTYETIPLGIITTKNCILTVCLKEVSVLRDFSSGSVKQVYTNMRTRFILQLLYKVASNYLHYLRQIDKLSNYIEKQLHLSMKNKELIQLLDLEKSLVFFSTSLKANEVTLEKVQRGRFIKLYEEDQDLLEDMLIEVKQAIEMSSIYSNILSGTMDAFASIISNNLNIVMRTLTVITILMAIPTMFASFYGMNVGAMPFPNFWFVVALSAVVTGVTGFILFRKQIF